MKKILKILGNLIQAVLILLIILTLAIVFLSRQQGVFSLRAFVISTGSMGQAIPVGSLIITRPQPEYHTDDIITYHTNDPAGNRQRLPTTHRIVEVVEGENLGFKTKGDANENTDPFVTPSTQLIGKVMFHLPYFGYFTDFIKTRNGLIFLIIIPATILAYSEIQTLQQEIKKLFQKKKKK